MDTAAVKNWLLRPDIRTAKFRGRQFALDYAVLWNATDLAQPVEDLSKLLDEIEGQPVAVVGSDGTEILRPHPISPNSSEILRPTPLPKVPPRKLPAGTRVRSSLSHFVDAYVPLRRGNYAAATNAFRVYLERFPIHGMSAEAYVISYMAAAAAKVGDPLGLETYLDARHPSLNIDSFDYWLAKAHFHSQRRQIAEAETALTNAFHSMVGVFDARPMIVQFQYAEACEWIYRETGDERFKRMLLDWSRRHQRIQPTQAWAYAMQYSYETDAAARERALAMTLYLDPRSHRIAKAKPNEMAKARSWLEQNNPFTREARASVRL